MGFSGMVRIWWWRDGFGDGAYSESGSGFTAVGAPVEVWREREMLRWERHRVAPCKGVDGGWARGVRLAEVYWRASPVEEWTGNMVFKLKIADEGPKGSGEAANKEQLV
ncbi:hypothetical protein CASFOL_013590 [Castilleja foliolosa]|uniref:Uncharacterized protein n=1 Tax=Castilleja foliolosa TaxID=1961234 RepID=A0ABD3DPH5_9LAMI